MRNAITNNTITATAAIIGTANAIVLRTLAALLQPSYALPVPVVPKSVGTVPGGLKRDWRPCREEHQPMLFGGARRRWS